MGFESGSGGEESVDGLGEGGVDFVKTSPNVTATEEAKAVPFV